MRPAPLSDPAWFDRPLSVVVSCEHATKHVPARYARLFDSKRARAELSSHRGSDLGAVRYARRISRCLQVECHEAEVSRLLVDLNRSKGRVGLFSRYSKRLPASERAELLSRYYEPFRSRVRSDIAGHVRRGRLVVHLSVHSYTPVLHGVVRTADIGLLYDPRRALERELCGYWQRRLREALAGVVVRRNYPYRGIADGHVTLLRREFGPKEYLGVELELNQQLISDRPHELERALVDELPRLGSA